MGRIDSQRGLSTGCNGGGEDFRPRSNGSGVSPRGGQRHREGYEPFVCTVWLKRRSFGW